MQCFNEWWRITFQDNVLSVWLITFSILFSTDTLWWSAWNAIPAQWPRTCQRPSWRGGQRSSHSSRLPTTTTWCPPVTPWTLTSPSPPSTRMPSRSHQRGRSPGRGHQLRSLFFCPTRLLWKRIYSFALVRGEWIFNYVTEVWCHSYFVVLLVKFWFVKQIGFLGCGHHYKYTLVVCPL